MRQNWVPMAVLFASWAGRAAFDNRAMQPESVRSEDIVARVVAWHNRHPLAARITAAQVHSVGVVSLPFAVAGAQVAPLPVADAARAPAQPAEPASAAEPPAAPEAAPRGDDSTLVELVTDPEPDGPAAGPDATAVDRQAATLTAEAAAAVTAAGSDDAAPAGPPTRPMALRRQVTLPPADRARGLRRVPQALREVWQRLRGRHPYRALFTEDFIAPLSARRVAAFATRHGRPEWPLEPEAPLRLVTLDPRRRRDGDAAPELDLHLITAAVGMGDRRVRLLVGAGRSRAVIGPRHWSRARLAAAGAPLSLLLVGALVSVVTSGPHGSTPVVNAVAAASAASAPAVAAASGVQVAQAHPPEDAASHATAALPHAASAASAHVASAPEAQHTAPEPPPVAAVAPVSVEPRRGRIDMAPLVPRLAGGERQALRHAAVSLRAPEPQAVPAKAWALATRPLADRGQSERAAAQLKALALLYRMPMRAELMQAGGAWRAVFWPFTNADDAEKVRLALADKGLKTEVIEF